MEAPVINKKHVFLDNKHTNTVKYYRNLKKNMYILKILQFFRHGGSACKGRVTACREYASVQKHYKKQ